VPYISEKKKLFSKQHLLLDGGALEVRNRNMGIILKCIISKEVVRVG
jgi:hypothetical protein